MADGGTNFMVDLAALQDAIGGVSAQRDVINEGIAQMRTTFSNIEDHWQGPAGSTFPPLAATFNTAADALTSLLEEAVGKMQTAHDNYASTEQTNGGNYTVILDSQGNQDQGNQDQGNQDQGNQNQGGSGQGNPGKEPEAQQGPGTQQPLQPSGADNPEIAPVEPDARVG
jgi:WXG100 family type VII secretion target